ncbi:hypothetical protein [Singulisphaera sp. PoT]|uniref:hypothetical protein n=1 Tax=Singulisphaera sp. PoT TaxID=3411797 RepID=UPI003BF5E2E2
MASLILMSKTFRETTTNEGEVPVGRTIRMREAKKGSVVVVESRTEWPAEMGEHREWEQHGVFAEAGSEGAEILYRYMLYQARKAFGDWTN